MKRLASIFVALGLAAAGSTALAAQPALMTDAQMDNVTAGADGGLVDVVIKNALNDWSISLDIGLQANVAANVNAAVALIGTAQATQGIMTQTQITGNLQ
jgi:Na+-translocating ferredoxin:NAD+ oxidoreductase RnfG subunit